MNFKENMRYFFLFLAITVYMPINAQNNLINGKLLDADNQNEPIIYGNVTLVETNQTVTTDYRGQYFFKDIQPGTYNLVFSFLGYETRKKRFVISKNKNITINTRLKQSEAPYLTNEKVSLVEF